MEEEKDISQLHLAQLIASYQARHNECALLENAIMQANINIDSKKKALVEKKLKDSALKEEVLVETKKSIELAETERVLRVALEKEIAAKNSSYMALVDVEANVVAIQGRRKKSKDTFVQELDSVIKVYNKERENFRPNFYTKTKWCGTEGS